MSNEIKWGSSQKGDYLLLRKVLPVMLQDLTEKDRSLVKMADMLELVLHCKRQMQMGNTLAEPIYTRGREYLYRKFSSNPDFRVVHSILLELK